MSAPRKFSVHQQLEEERQQQLRADSPGPTTGVDRAPLLVALEAAAEAVAALDDPAAYVAGRLRRLLRLVVACLDVNCNGKIDRVDLQKAGEKGVPWARCSRSGARGRCGRGSRRRRSEEVDEFVFH